MPRLTRAAASAVSGRSRRLGAEPRSPRTRRHHHEDRPPAPLRRPRRDAPLPACRGIARHPLASLYTSLDKLEEEVGHALINREGTPRLTHVGELFLVEAQAAVAAAPPPAPKNAAPAGGKAKASKGKGRAPIVKGQPKPYKKRQGR